MAAVFTMAVTIALTIYTFTTTSDPTVIGSFLFVVTTVLFVAGIYFK